MYIIEHKLVHGTKVYDEDHFSIPGIDRDTPSVRQFIELADLNIKLTCPTAFLYIDGVSFTPSDAGIGTVSIDPLQPTIKTTSSYAAHSWARTFSNKQHLVRVDTISGTCAAGIQAIYEADRLIEGGVCEEVIIIGGERISQATIKLFKELRIPVVCGDGFVYMRLCKGTAISDIQWKYHYNNNLFKFPSDVIASLCPPYPLDYVKLHDTGTESNTIAESALASLAPTISYKKRIGHTQGVSSLLETCMVLEDDSYKGNILVTANGMGGYYGSFTLRK